jgi:hypothetical protein
MHAKYQNPCTAPSGRILLRVVLLVLFLTTEFDKRGKGKMKVNCPGKIILSIVNIAENPSHLLPQPNTPLWKTLKIFLMNFFLMASLLYAFKIIVYISS